MKIETMDKATAKIVREIITNGLTPLLAEYGLEFELGNAGYDADSVKFNGFKVRITGGLSDTEKALERELNFRQCLTDMVELDVDRISSQGSRRFKLVGFKERARKNPFVVLDLNSNTGAEYVLSVEQVERMFAVKGDVE